jgi:acetylornithine deacetylase
MSEVSNLLAALVAINSVNPALVPGGAGETAFAAFIAEWLDRRGFAVRRHEACRAGPRSWVKREGGAAVPRSC